MGKFKVGDIVRGISNDFCITNTKMTKGEVTEIINNEFIRVKVIKHKDNSHIHIGTREYVVLAEYFELVSSAANNSIHIYSDGKTTTAILKDGKKTVKTAQAKCSPDDTYDFNIGAKLAFDRLIGVENKAVREVNRRANIGEWVKVVNAEYVPTDNGIPSYKMATF